MKIRKLVAPVGIAAVAVGMAAGTAVPASAANNIKPFGTQESLNDVYRRPNDHLHGEGALPELRRRAPQRPVVCSRRDERRGHSFVALFNARAESRETRIGGGGIPGTLYFDVVGDPPNSVVYNDGVQDLCLCGGSSRGVSIRWSWPAIPQESPPRSSVGHLLKAAGYLLKALQQGATRRSPRSSRRPPSSSPNRRWLSQGSMQVPAGVADCSVGRFRRHR